MATMVIFETAIFLGVAFLLYVIVALEFEIRRTHRQKDLREQVERNCDDRPRLNAALVHRPSHV